MKVAFYLSTENEDTEEVERLSFEVEVPEESEEDFKKLFEKMDEGFYEDFSVHEVT